MRKLLIVSFVSVALSHVYGFFNTVKLVSRIIVRMAVAAKPYYRQRLSVVRMMSLDAFRTLMALRARLWTDKLPDFYRVSKCSLRFEFVPIARFPSNILLVILFGVIFSPLGSIDRIISQQSLAILGVMRSEIVTEFFLVGEPVSRTSFVVALSANRRFGIKPDIVTSDSRTVEANFGIRHI